MAAYGPRQSSWCLSGGRLVSSETGFARFWFTPRWSLPEPASTGRAEVDRPDPGGDVEAAIALEAQGLQGDRVVGAADQRIGAEADTDGGAGGASGIAAGQRTRRQVGGWRDHRPDQDAALGVADIDPELHDVADIMLDAAGAGEGAVEGARG